MIQVSSYISMKSSSKAQILKVESWYHGNKLKKKRQSLMLKKLKNQLLLRKGDNQLLLIQLHCNNYKTL